MTETHTRPHAWLAAPAAEFIRGLELLGRTGITVLDLWFAPGLAASLDATLAVRSAALRQRLGARFN